MALLEQLSWRTYLEDKKPIEPLRLPTQALDQHQGRSYDGLFLAYLFALSTEDYGPGGKPIRKRHDPHYKWILYQLQS
jgi:hypothetical protein